MRDLSFSSNVNWSFIALIGRNILQFVSTIVLARLLAPEDFGLMAMVGTLTNLLAFFSDVGLSWVSIQKKEISDSQISDLFWLNSFVGLLLGLLCLPGAYFLNYFYSSQSLIAICQIQVLTFVFLGLGVQPLALLRKRLQFKNLAQVEIISAAAALVISLTLAWWGYGVWALALNPVCSQLFRTLLAFKKTKIQIYSIKIKRSIRENWRDGGHLLSANFFFYVLRNLDDIFIGRFVGPQALGFYSRGYVLTHMLTHWPSQSFGQVVITTMAGKKENTEDDLATEPSWYQLFRKSLMGYCMLVCPLAALLMLTSHDAILFLYGPKWKAAVPVLFWLSAAAIFQPLFHSIGWALVGLSKNRAYFLWSMISALVAAIAFYFAVQRGMYSVAIAYFVVVGLTLSISSQVWLHIYLKISPRQLLRDLGLLSISIGIMMAAVLALQSIDLGRSSLNFLLQLVLGIIVYLGAVRIFLPVHILPFFNSILGKNRL